MVSLQRSPPPPPPPPTPPSPPHPPPPRFVFRCLQLIMLFVCGFAGSDMMHGCMVYTERRAETATVSCGTSHASAVSTPLRWIFKTALQKAIHSCRLRCECSESARERRIAWYKSDQQEQEQIAAGLRFSDERLAVLPASRCVFVAGPFCKQVSTIY